MCTITNLQVEMGLGGTCLLVTGFKVFAEFFSFSFWSSSVRFLDFCKNFSSTNAKFTIHTYGLISRFFSDSKIVFFNNYLCIFLMGNHLFADYWKLLTSRLEVIKCLSMYGKIWIFLRNRKGLKGRNLFFEKLISYFKWDGKVTRISYDTFF